MHTINRKSRSHRPTAISTVALCCAALALGACSDNNNNSRILAPTLDIPIIVVTPGSTTLRTGATQQLSAEVRDGSTQTPISGATVTWSSADSLVARVSESGLVTVVGPGTAGITAKYKNSVGVAAITALGPVVNVSLSAAQTTLAIGQTTQLTASPLDGTGVPQPRDVVYSSSAPTIVSVSSTGLVTAVGAGTATITATSESKTGSVTITVTPPIPVVVTPATSLVGAGGTRQLTVVLRDPVTGAILTGQTITYTSSDTAIAKVSSSGLVSVARGGSATITATSSGRSGTATVTSIVTNNTPVVIAGDSASSISYYVNVPAGATKLTVTLANSTSDDADIEVYNPSNTQVCTSGNTASNESCVITSPVVGLYRVRIIGYTKYANVTFKAVIE